MKISLKLSLFVTLSEFFNYFKQKLVLKFSSAPIKTKSNQKCIRHIALCHIKMHFTWSSLSILQQKNYRKNKSISIFFSLSLSVIICLAKFFAAKNYNVVFIVIKFELTAVYISSKNTFKRWMVIYFIRVNTVSKNNIAHGKFKKKMQR